MPIYVEISYDVSSNQEDFREKLDEMGWKYVRLGKRMHHSSCRATFTSNFKEGDEEAAKQVAIADLEKARDFIRRTKDRSFNIERYSIVSAWVGSAKFTNGSNL